MSEPNPTSIHAVEGMILSRHLRERAGQLYLEFWLKTEAGPCKVISTVQKDVFFIAQRDLLQAEQLLKQAGLTFETRALSLKSFDQQRIGAVYFTSSKLCYRARSLLEGRGLHLYEADIRLSDRFLMERFIYGSMQAQGRLQQRSSYVELSNARCLPSNYRASFRCLSLDIECSEAGELFSIGLAARDWRCVLMIGEAERGENTLQSPSWLTYVDNEAALLNAFVDKLQHYDPDVIVGWNVLNFDMRLLNKRAQLHRLKLALGRDGELMHVRERRDDSNQAYVTISGRVVIDGIDALRSATYHFDSFSLEFVAQQLLGKGKLSENVDDRLAEIEHDFKYNKIKLANYNLQDCNLVLDIFEHCDLLNYLSLRSQLTGLELQRMGGSVAAFINVYLPKLHRAGYVSPRRPDDGGLASPGGYVMESKPGLYTNVLVLDFKSLYPSIIRTFLIDPLGLVEGLQAPADAVPGFKGAKFSRDKHFLPDIIDTLWQARDEAKAAGDAARSQAIKILMNSFYGVLGSGGCPFYDTRLASSITMRGQEIMQQTAAWIEAEGYEVIYGDTDSTFVYLAGDYDHKAVCDVGLMLQQRINELWQNKLEQSFNLPCALELEFETHFSQFLMPTIRGSSQGSKKRYAGVKKTEHGEQLVFKGLETVRSDWTQLAKDFQAELYQRVFSGQDVKNYIRTTIVDTLAGVNDDKLIYRKRLRRKLELYVLSSPPQVKAARHADELNLKAGKKARYQNKGWINYVQTVSGPQALEHRQASIDYQHYIDKQLKPVAEAILPFVNLSFDELANAQLALF
ncbi:DNA polymerase II [Agaribacterium haliotis]|uniref:DNA polymerase II n=1 Tax=Agaribacterium haliotis TaxID=2013869 RepID=UPI000BB57C78|nr:DNA polymerase II [Agaribacterium haliotis]